MKEWKRKWKLLSICRMRMERAMKLSSHWVHTGSAIGINSYSPCLPELSSRLPCSCQDILSHVNVGIRASTDRRFGIGTSK